MDCAGVCLLRRAKVILVNINGEREVLGRNAAVKLILAKNHCPVCALLPTEHDDKHCDMRYVEEKHEENTAH